MPSLHRYPPEELARTLGITPDQMWEELAQQRGESANYWRRLAQRRNGWSWWQADRNAQALGTHGFIVWGWPFVDEVMEEYGPEHPDEEPCRWCERLHHRNSQWCSDACRDRSRYRRRKEARKRAET